MTRDGVAVSAADVPSAGLRRGAVSVIGGSLAEDAENARRFVMRKNEIKIRDGTERAPVNVSPN